jgi:hypothetical protein
MPSIMRRASKILNEYGAVQSDLIGKAVVLTDGKAGTVENVWLDELGFGFPSRVMMEDGRSQASSLQSPRLSHRLRVSQIARSFQSRKPFAESPLYPDERTSSDRPDRSVSCEQRSSIRCPIQTIIGSADQMPRGVDGARYKTAYSMISPRVLLGFRRRNMHLRPVVFGAEWR